MTKYYADMDVEVGGARYDDKIVSAPSIQKSTPEFLAGIEPPVTTSVVIEDVDDVLKIQRRTSQFRGKIIEIAEAFYYGESIETPDENNVVYTGVVDTSSIATGGVTLTATTQGLDVLDKMLPIRKVNTTLFPSAVDLDSAINEVIGTAKKVPLPLVSVTETPTIEFKYMVGRGNLTVDVVYRDNLVISEFSGTAQAGSTASTIKLASADAHSNDFYNEAYVEITGGTGAGQVRKITNYVASTRVASITPNWTITPSATSTYKIREWGRFLETVDGEPHTVLIFAITQRDESFGFFSRDRMAADVTGLQTERNPARAVETLITQLGGTVNAASATTAAADITTIGGLFVDGAIVEEVEAREKLDQICIIGRIFLSLNSAGEYELSVIGLEDMVTGHFKDEDNIESLSESAEESLFSMWKNIKVKYRKQFNENEFRLVSEAKTVVSNAKIEQEFEYDMIFDKTTADKVADFLAKVKAGTEMPLTIGLGHEARMAHNLDLILLDIPALAIDSVYQVVGTQIDSGVYSLTVVPRMSTLNTYVAGVLPSDPVTDARADFRFTPPSAVTSLNVSWSITAFNVSAKAALSWIIPTENFKEAIVEYKLDASSLYTVAGTTSGTTWNITGLTPGQLYDFRVTSVNFFDLQGGVATIDNSLAPGDTAAPATPTGLQSDVSLGLATWTWNENAESDLYGYQYDIRTATGGGGTLIKAGFTTDNSVTHTLTTGNLTTVVTRYLRVRAKDFSNNVSSYTTAIAASTTPIVQDDIVNDEITNKSRAQVSTISLYPAGTEIIGTSITKRASTRIRIEFSCTHESGTGFSAWPLELRRNGGIIQYPWAGTYVPSDGSASVSAVYDDNFTSSGPVDYSITLFAGASANTGRNLTLRLLELRR